MSKVYKLSPQARARTIGAEGVVVLQEEAEVLITNETGARMLELCQSGASLEALAHALRTEFGADATQAQVDAKTFVESLRAAGAIFEEERP